MLDPYITPCCDQKQLRYFFERVDGAGYATFYCEPDYSFGRFLRWVVPNFPMSEVTIASQEMGQEAWDALQPLLVATYFIYSKKCYAPLVIHLNLIVGKDVNVPEAFLNNPRVTVAKDNFTYNFILFHMTRGNEENKTAEEDTAAMLTALDALKEKTQTLKEQVSAGTVGRLNYEELEGAWIDYLISSGLTTSSKDRYYTLRGFMTQHTEIAHNTSSVTCIKGKRAYDEVMNTLSSVLRTKKVKATN